jgi:assimilatory nitrate reductase catalytic subunit
VLNNRRSPEIVVIDPRATETAMAATQHLALRPKSDLVLFYGTARALIARGAVDRKFVEAHTSDFEAFAEFVQPFDVASVCAATGLAEAAFERFVEIIATRPRVSFWWTMGVNQGHQSTRTAQAIINLALLTGNIGRPGTGANSITGQCNAMGSRLFSNTTSLLGGHDFANAAHREKIARALRIPVEQIPTTNSWAYDQILDGIDRGVIKGLWIIATNPAHSWIASPQLAERLARLEFLVVQDMYASTETAKLAHLVLPAAGAGEKEGTFINSERRIGVVKKVARAPGMALADFHIFRLIANYWGCDALFREWTSPQAVFQILKRCTAGQPCDITDIEDFRHLEACGGIQWPWRQDEAGSTPPRERRLFADGRFFHADGKAKFIFEPPRDLPETPDAEFPFILLTGRGTSAQWHTLTRTGKSDMLRRLAPAELHIEVHPEDARHLGLRGGAMVRVVSRRGTTEARTAITATVQRGQVFLPMHFAGTNQLTLPVCDARSRQPAYKFAAVRLEKIS